MMIFNYSAMVPQCAYLKEGYLSWTVFPLRLLKWAILFLLPI